ncbi:MFS transporter [Bacillus sp. FJAT-47783]|uniref:MDR family MFS transporter n=1 Tax=Bacillus sp. FJAT-47783 TaxID=2922712 RepID=UPI001FAD7F02|nr:MFS transporter [Bacillus sp. FJAT-47783]
MPRSLWLLIIGMAINVTGASFLWPLNTIYIHDHLGKSLTMAGIVLMLNSGASVVGNMLGGILFDRIGGFRSIMAGIITTLASLIVLVFFHDWPAYIILLTLIGFGQGIVFPSMYALAGAVWPEGERRAFNAIYIAQNSGVAIGSALGGIVANISFEFIFIANTLLYIVFFMISYFGYRNLVGEKGVHSTILKQRTYVKNRQKYMALVTLTIGYLLAWVTYSQWPSTFAAYSQEMGIGLHQYSLLWTVNGALIVLGQPLLSAFIKRLAKSLKVQMFVGFMMFILSYIVMSNATQFTGFMAAMIIITIGEMLVWPAVPTIANKLAPKGREGFYQGFVNSMATGGRMIGPLLGGVIVDVFGIRWLFVAMIGLLCIGTITAIIYDRSIVQKNNKQMSLTH